MAWTTRVVKIDKDTGEVLNDNAIATRNLEVKFKTKLYHKIHDTHEEIVIIRHYGPRAQQQLQF